ncbi:LacI family DNA-binding transcriptional regulator [Bacillus sp. SD088]|uniref:LacI family DNA-binding transcriptional regulator n=1 Tax=Bacillus sp. SD088 TaxID=2782012 RepID=UPI001F62194C|nr:LacI family DNA-binding transcriptional regulator [Bacillus sp. SD088]
MVKITIYDVAEEAGVSIATVSKVINNTGRIGKVTREKVLQAMEKLNYQPSFVASALTGKKTETIGLLVPDISNPFFSEIARTIEDRAHERGKSVIMCSTNYNEKKEKKYIELLQRKQVDGIIVTSGFQNRTLVQQMQQNGTPLALLAQDDPILNVSVVSVDDFKGGYMAASFLFENGHTNIGIIGEKVQSSKMRVYGCLEALEMEGIQVEKKNVINTTASIENGRKGILQLLDCDNPPTAVFAVNDLIAIGAIKGAREVGVLVPEDLSIIGFDNTILATTTVPELTTIAQPMRDMGNKIVDILIEEIETENSTKNKERILFVPELIVRGTTANLLVNKI